MKNELKCKICLSLVDHVFNSKVLGKYDVGYYKCFNCGFIQTDEPYWLDEAYGDAITSLDLGLISRNIGYSEFIANLINSNFDIHAKFLDYAGGYGMFTRLMRDKGLDYYHYDKFCIDLYAKNFELEDLPKKTKFEFVTAFEVFEHFVDPIREIKEIFKYSDTVVFSTELQPNLKFNNSDQWWYFTPETGQHIAFYSKKSLEFLANKMNLFFYTQNNLHILSKRKFNENKLFSQSNEKINLESLLQKDFDLVKKIENLKTKKILNKKSEKSLFEMVSIFAAKFESVSDELKIYKSNILEKENEIFSIAEALKNKENEIFSIAEALKNKENEIFSIAETLKNKENESFLLKSKIVEMQNTKLWIASEKIRKFFNIVLPKYSMRRKFFKRLAVSFKYLFKIPKIIKIKAIDNLIRNLKRKTNRESKKIVYIGHSYHDKTQSTSFLINYLKEYFEVEVILDETWLGKSPPNLDFIDKSYLGVVFFQNIYSPEIINRIKNKNIIFFPMYDYSGNWKIEYWNNYKNLKFINFSSTLHKKLINFGFDSIYLQFFPKPKKMIFGQSDSIFFWQRLTNINIDILEKILPKNVKYKIHLHKALDPNHFFLEPSRSQNKKYVFSYSSWFKEKADLTDLIKKSAIYIAPREYEGIGLSYLEAMSMGKAVVAIDNPTMNEYISNNKTGYLIDVNNLKKIDFSNLKNIQKNCFHFMENGYSRWEKNKIRIINFIRK